MGRGRSQRTQELVEQAAEVLAAENPMTLRQLFYRLVSVRLLENRQSDYHKLSRIMTSARERGEVPFEWMVDRSRPTYEPNVFHSASEYIEVVKSGYRRDYWTQQPCHVEVWTEKDAILGSIQPITDKYGVTVRVGRGFLSTTRAYEVAKHFLRLGKPIYVLYLGDHDPSGRDIERDAQERITDRMIDFALSEGNTSFLPRLMKQDAFSLRRVAIQTEDILEFSLPPLRIKASDPRAVSFYREHGVECVELDALPPSELRHRLEEAIVKYIDRRPWKQAIVVERAELASIKKFADTFARLKAGPLDV